MKLGIPREHLEGERRVAATPKNLKRLQKLGFDIVVAEGAGIAAGFSDKTYQEAGATVVTPAVLWSQCELIATVRPPRPEDVSHMKEGATLISFLYPDQHEKLMKALASRKANALAMERIPRITRCQKMDALSSMANIAGYRAVVEAAEAFGSFFTGQMTAAGKVNPAKVMVIGAGVAGLAAIGAARGMGAIVRAFDTRPVVKEQVESMGAEFLELQFEEDGTGEGGYAKTMSKEFIDAEMKLFAEQAEEVDIIITTALIPGRPAPKLILKDCVEKMKEGSVIVDLAAEQGGNCEVTVPDTINVHHGVKVIGFTDLTSRMAPVASELYGNNIAHLLDDMISEEDGYKVDLEDEAIRGACAMDRGTALDRPPPPKPSPQTAAPKETPAPVAAPVKEKKKGSGVIPVILASVAIFAAGWGGDSTFLNHLTVFVLACFIGYQIIWNVSAALHTPLMAVTNAISGIIIVGGVLQLTAEPGSLAMWLGAIAVGFAFINISGGFLVTQRMLKMFRK